MNQTSWYEHIVSVHEQSGVYWVETDLSTNSAARDAASSICSAISAYQLDQGEFVGVTVRAASGERLSLRMDMGDSC